MDHSIQRAVPANDRADSARASDAIRRGPPFFAVFVAPERKRLHTEVVTAQESFTAAPEDASLPVLAGIQSLLGRAAHEAERGDLDAGGKYLHEAQRERIRFLDDDALEGCIVALRSGANGKLNGWRKQAVLALLLDLETRDDSRQRTLLREARRIVDEHSDKTYFRNRLLRTQMTVISAAVLMLGVAFAWLLVWDPQMLHHAKNSEFGIPTTLGAMVLGGMGACFSALSMFANRTTSQRIPSHLANVTITATRPLLGLLAGLAAVLCIDSGSLNVGPASLLLPFVFGFSDRVVMAALGEGKPEDIK